MPFILRRLKDEVLKDLPPKIIQDYYCDLTEIQHKLYKKFDIDHLDVSNQKESALSKLILMRKLCNHPSMVLPNPTFFPEFKADKEVKDVYSSGKI